jgi:acyl carrier protein
MEPPPVADRSFTELAQKVAAVTSLPASGLAPDTAIADLALDSMTTVELVVDLQEDYDIALSREDFAEVRTLGDLADLVFSRLPDPAGA